MVGSGIGGFVGHVEDVGRLSENYKEACEGVEGYVELDD